MTKRKQDKEETENDAPGNQREDNVCDVSKGSTRAPRKKRVKARSNVSVTIEATTKLDKENAQKLQRQRETLIAQGASESYPLQNSVSPKLCDAIGQLLLLSEATEIEHDVEKEREAKRLAQLLEKNEKLALESLAQQRVHDARNDDVAQTLKSMTSESLKLAPCVHNDGQRQQVGRRATARRDRGTQVETRHARQGTGVDV